MENDQVDLVIAWESPQWETYEYARDAVTQGRSKVVVFLGHIPSEESVTNFCAECVKKSFKEYSHLFY